MICQIKGAIKSGGIGFPILYGLSIPGQTIGHDVAINGYIKYRVTYKKYKTTLLIFKSKETETCTKDFTFYSLFDGTNAGLRYIDTDAIKSRSVAAYAINYK